MTGKNHHSERAHSKFSASGSERWENCPGSVELSEGQPDKTSPWAEEGTRAHEVLEAFMRVELSGNDLAVVAESEPIIEAAPSQMVDYAVNAMQFITKIHYATPGSEISAEERIYLDFIHPEMFGTYDSKVAEHFGTLHVFDYKYGAGHAVSPKENLQMIFYAIGIAHKYHWNFTKARLWIIQPRIKGYDGPMFWDISIDDLYGYVERFRDAVRFVEEFPDLYVEGSWCHWCKAKSVCPIKAQSKLDQAKHIFSKG